MLDLSRAPDTIGHLVRWLTDHGFKTTEECSSDRNNQYAVFEADGLTVKITASRGDWSLGIGLQGRTVHPEQWEAWLDDYPLAGPLADLDHQVHFITHRWKEAVARAHERPEAENEIRAIGDGWVQRQFGFRPPRA